ncbi:hypothetical protein Ddc_16529 [Ditylenchus destructor]|nr:hypothetical protein Ddc_16529 [Ditylenchus destructor]
MCKASKYEELLFSLASAIRCNRDSLFETFSKYGNCACGEVKRDRNTNRCVALDTYLFTAEQTVRAINSGQYILNGKVLRVEPCKTHLGPNVR